MYEFKQRFIVQDLESGEFLCPDPAGGIADPTLQPVGWVSKRSGDPCPRGVASETGGAGASPRKRTVGEYLKI